MPFLSGGAPRALIIVTPRKRPKKRCAIKAGISKIIRLLTSSAYGNFITNGIHNGLADLGLKRMRGVRQSIPTSFVLLFFSVPYSNNSRITPVELLAYPSLSPSSSIIHHVRR